MSFSLSADNGALEWGSHGLGSFFAQRGNLCSPSFMRMFVDMIRFNNQAARVLLDENKARYRDLSLGQYLQEHHFSDAFAKKYLLPMCAAIWSVPSGSCLGFPVQTVVAFLQNHHMLQMFSRPQWRVVKGRSRCYVEKIVDVLPDVRTNAAVMSVDRKDGRSTIHDSRGGVDTYDALVMATHTDIALKILGKTASKDERALLGAIPYQDNDIILHKDASLMPQRRAAWASWNVLEGPPDDFKAQAAPVCVTYWVNSLQHVADGIDRFVTLNAIHEPAEGAVIRRLNLAHPCFSFEGRSAQEELGKLQGKNGTWFCGAWCGWGFHEDGLKSAVNVASAMGAPPPWVPRSLSPTVPFLHSFAIQAFEKIARMTITRGSLRVIMPTGHELNFGNPDPGADPDAVHIRLRVFDTSFFSRAVKDMDVGLGEAYMYGDYDVNDLTDWIKLLVHNIDNVDAVQGKLGLLNWFGGKMQSAYHVARANTITGSRRNIQEHYDLGNDM
jgi:predicted NAD/FAD-binding protein